MKKIKILSIFFLSLFTLFISCEDSEDASDVDYDVITEGIVTTLRGTTGKLLGSVVTPSDLENSEVVLSDVNAELTLKLAIEPGQVGENVSKYELVKSFNGGTDVLVTETTTLPISIAYNSVDEYFDGFTVDPKDLRIGDKIEFKVKVFTTTGNVYYQGSNSSKYSVVINCASDLAATYTIAYASGDLPHVVTELSPGLYQISSMMAWPTSGYLVTFTDTCGEINLIDDWQFSNPIYGKGFVDTNGDLVWESVGVDGVYDDRQYRMVRQ
jgi:hypothetical protein